MQNKNVTELDTALPEELGEPMDVVTTPQAQETTGDRPIIIGGTEYQTNIPDGIDVLHIPNDSALEYSTVIPSGLDSLSPGEYTTHGLEDSGDFFAGGKQESEKKIKINLNQYGKTVSSDSLRARFMLSQDAGQLVQVVGFDVSEANSGVFISGIPTPETVKSACSLVGVDVRLMPEFKTIPGEDYLGAFAAEQYPVATADENSYAHDIEDDHITAMVLGGEPLKKALATAAKEALSTGDQNMIKKRTYEIDNFTATLRGVVSDCVSLLGEAYGSEMGRATLIKSGQAMGLEPETVEEILATAQESGRALGLDIKNLK